MLLCCFQKCFLIQRFYKNLLRDEGYLMLTLPASVHQQVWSKLIVSSVWFIITGVVVGLFAKKLNLQEGDFNKGKVITYTISNVIAHLIAWIVVAPVLDILIYAEPAKKVFAQGAFAAISNIITAVVVGGLLVLAYTKTIAKKGSLDKE